ncbi:MAG: hypothetical protein HWD82_03475 [Flavobacteriaceae bacterium]|nr:hypothetical protein [Flavobacteriaceae bacterium]
MESYKKIEQKLHQFSRKYYTNELIKGSILFFSIGALYLFCILFIEYFLWLKPSARTILFILFIAFETFLFLRFIVYPIVKLIGFKEGITFDESSKIIGNHFPEVKDKLLNVLQLKNTAYNSDLILASIEQKSLELQPIPFIKAIDFKENKKYIKFALIPVLVYLISLFTVTNASLGDSLKRVVDYRTAYEPPAPFSFVLETTNLKTIQGNTFEITFKVIGSSIPEEVKIFYDNQTYYLQKTTPNTFSFTFSEVQNNISFYLEANNVQSKTYELNVIKTPTINSIVLELDYPNYTKRKDEVIQNTANLTIPVGTKVTWKATTIQTDSLAFITNASRDYFSKIDENSFNYTKNILIGVNYQITSSNTNLKDYESLQYAIDVVKDEFPIISVTSDIDSISRGTAQFAGQISDDYGLKKLNFVYYDEDRPTLKKQISLNLSKENIQTFFFQFPNNVELQKGVNYEMYFQVFDNDGVNGNKSAKSKVFSYRQKTDEELEQEFLEEQRNTIQNIENSLQKQEKQQQQLDEIQQELQNKKNLNWNDKKKIDNFIKRQEQYKQMMQRQTDKLEENLDEKQEKEPSLQEKKEDLKERIKELKKLEKQQRLLYEIQKMADKLNKEDLVQKAKELAQQNRQQQRSLEKTLEMVKRFYVEQKTMQIANKIDELSKKQEEVAKKENSTLAEQNKIKEEFNEIKKELDELNKDNEKLKEPLELPDVKNDEKEVDNALTKSEEELKQQNSKQAKQSQKQSSKKMKEMSAKMQQQMMEMQGESMEENMDDLRKILENLIIFSFQQEQLMKTFSEISTSHPDFGKDLKKQNEIKTYFEHIDDSLYVLSMRVPKISTTIQDDLSSAHYNLDQSLYNFTENRFNTGISNQRYVITAANNLADYLSNILNNMKNNMSMKMGKGKPKKQNGFTLPDLIKKQENLSEKMQKGLEKGEKKSDGKEGDKPNENNNGKKQCESINSNEDLDGELFEIFKQQSQLRQQLQDAIQENESENPGANSNAKKALKKMEELENEILEKGFNRATLQKMQNLNYELLKLDTAKLQQGKDKKRKSEANKKVFERNKVKALQFKKQFYNQIEILNRQSLPLQQIYKKKVRAYFSDQKKE